MTRPLIVSIVSGYPYNPDVTATLIGYARCSTDKQDLAAQRAALLDLSVAEDRIYLDRGLAGPTRARPGLGQALAAVCAGEHSIADLAELFEVSRATVYRALDRANAATA